MKLLQLLALSLDLPEAWFDDKFTSPVRNLGRPRISNLHEHLENLG